MQAKGSESQLVSVTTPIDDHHVEVSTLVVILSPSRPTTPWRAKSLRDTKTPIKTPIDGHHVVVFAIVTIPSLSCHTSPQKAKSLGDVLPDNDTLVLQIHFSSLDDLETTNVGGDPHIGASIISNAIVEFNSDHITVENWVISKFCVDPNEMEKHAVILGRK